MDQEKMRAALQRVDKAFAKRPEAARTKKVARAIVREGTRCEYSDDEWSYVADMPETLGGTAAGPTPGTFARAALSTCLAIGYSMRAAYLGVPLRSVEVELHAEVDNRGIFCGQAQAPIYSSLTYIVTVDSDAPEADIQRVLDEADERSPYLVLFRTPQVLRREMHLVRGEALAEVPAG